MRTKLLTLNCLCINRKNWEAWSRENFQGSTQETRQHFFNAFAKFAAAISDERSDDSLAGYSAMEAGRPVGSL
ncbi:hypothetical protein VU02_02220 [Desulfobulbus sp. N2]|nr:hypothetical protein [Desulfobulbus sp. N2]